MAGTERSRAGRRPTGAERELWRRAMRDAVAWPGRETGAAWEAAPRVEDSGAEPPARRAKSTKRPPAPEARSARAAPELAPGRFPGLDRRSAERLRRGRLPVEATIDLHGMRQAEAERALAAFLAGQAEAGRRCVLVVTGKGRTGGEAGVLRREVPRWLNQPGNRARVLGFAQAQPRHGGAGALYVLLKRRRG